MEAGTMPAINLNTNLKKRYGLNFKWESRQFIKEENKSWDELGYRYKLSDLSLMFSKNVGLNNALAAGYLLRIEQGNIIHRATQQYTVVDRFNLYRLAHRFRTDQTFGKTEDFEFRLRYRLTLEFALNGTHVDPKEFYLKLNNEYLNAFQSDFYDLEIRLVPQLGHAFTDENKIEFGFDYRIDSFLDSAPTHVIWLNFNWYLKI